MAGPNLKFSESGALILESTIGTPIPYNIATVYDGYSDEGSDESVEDADDDDDDGDHDEVFIEYWDEDELPAEDDIIRDEWANVEATVDVEDVDLNGEVLMTYGKLVFLHPVAGKGRQYVVLGPLGAIPSEDSIEWVRALLDEHDPTTKFVFMKPGEGAGMGLEDSVSLTQLGFGSAAGCHVHYDIAKVG